MQVHLNIIIYDNGKLERKEWHIGDFTEEQLKERNDFQQKIGYHDGDESKGTKRSLSAWFTISLEDHEREAQATNKPSKY